jgi:3-hydroxy-3-methylglutaryl CoA synthase
LVGIIDYSTYTPSYRLARKMIAEQWGTKNLGGVKAVANYDQDALTMGFEAAWNLVERDQTKSQPDGLYFASTTAPYWQRASSSFIAAACDLADEIETVDFGGSLRCGTAALRAALNAVVAGANRKVLVSVSDVRDAAPESVEEQRFGDGAVALCVGREGVIAELVAHASRSDDFLDEWRRDKDEYVSSLPSRYSLDRGYIANTVAIGKHILDLAHLKASEVSHVALSCPDGKAHFTAARKLGFTPNQLVDVPITDGGLTGAPLPIVLLCKALDNAKRGDFVLAIGHGDGADALLFRVTDEKHKVDETSTGPPLNIPTYSVYRKQRDFNRAAEEGGVISNVTLEQEDRQNVRLHATRCPNCNTVQFPITVVCVRCHNRTGLQEVRMCRRGTLFTFTKDYLYHGPVSPVGVGVIELEDGARFYCQLTDVDTEAIKIGTRMQLTLRRLKDGGKMHHYYWKCRPVDMTSVV